MQNGFIKKGTTQCATITGIYKFTFLTRSDSQSQHHRRKVYRL